MSAQKKKHHMGLQEVLAELLRGQKIPDESPGSRRLPESALSCLSWTGEQQESFPRPRTVWLGWKSTLEMRRSQDPKTAYGHGPGPGHVEFWMEAFLPHKTAGRFLCDCEKRAPLPKLCLRCMFGSGLYLDAGLCVHKIVCRWPLLLGWMARVCLDGQTLNPKP